MLLNLYSDILLDMKNFLRSNIFLVSLLIIIVLGLYANSLGGGFVYDDKPMILTYDLVKDIGNIPKAFVNPTSIYGNTNYYRPLQTISNMLDYYLWGNVPAGYHATNIFFHALAVVFLFWFLQILFKRKKLAFITALIFAVHPVNTSVVSYIAGRADSMLFCFMLLSMGFYVKAVYLKKKSKDFYFSLIFFIMALLVKENAMIIPIFFLLFDKYLVKYSELKERKVDYSRYTSYLIIVISYFVFRITKMSFFVEGAMPPYPFFNRLITVPYSVAQYFRLVIFPNDLHMGRLPWVAGSIGDIRILISLVAVSAIIAFVFIRRKGNKPAWFGLCWFSLMIFPVLNIITPLFYTFAENWLYIPSIGLYLVISSFFLYLLDRLKGKLKYVITGSFCLFILIMSSLTVKQNLTWSNEISLGMNTLKFNPREFKVWNNMGVVYLGRGDLERAEKAFKKCLEIKPDTGMAYFNLYRIYIRRNDRLQAIRYLDQARKYDPKRVGILIEKMGIRD